MAKFDVAVDKMVFIDGVLTTIKAGQYETTEKEKIEVLRKAQDVKEVKASTKSKGGA